jgi:hypothetical protein
MAKRGNKGKSAGRGKKAALALDVETEDGGEAAAPAGLENGLVLVTFLALVVALVLSQIELSSSYGKGLF